MIAAAFLIVLGIYLGCGLIFAILFVLNGAGKVDPHAAHGPWGFRMLILPGAAALWPWLLCRWLAAIRPSEKNPGATKPAA
jgi:hypothetical protein